MNFEEIIVVSRNIYGCNSAVIHFLRKNVNVSAKIKRGALKRALTWKIMQAKRMAIKRRRGCN